MKPRRKDLLWLAAGAALFAGVALIVFLLHPKEDPASLLALKAWKLERVQRMRIALTSASEAEKSAVMAVTDEESRAFADQARAATTAVDQLRHELEEHLIAVHLQNELGLLARFAETFKELRVVDEELLDLAVRNSNLKAYRLAFGPAAEALAEMDSALSRIMKEAASSDSPGAKQVMLHASSAQSASLRIQALLPPHIAEETDARMDALEASMGREDIQVREHLDALAALPEPGSQEAERVASSYARFTETRKEILKLSRENTNLRSLTISLGRKRNLMSLCQDVLAALEQAIQAEPIPGVTYGLPARPR
jgi:hypothetical protein